MTNRKLAIAAVLLLPFTCVACGGKPQPTADAAVEIGAKGKEATPQREDYVGADKKVDPGVLVFEEQVLGERFSKLRACFGDVSDEGWTHYPLRKIGNFVQEDWCVGTGNVSNCAGGSFRETPGDRWRSLHTLHYDSDWPKVFGLGAVAGDLPKDGSWGVRFSYHTGGKRIMGEGLHVAYIRYEGGKQVQLVHLGDFYSYEIEETDIKLVSPLGKDGELSALLESSESLMKTGVARFSEMEKKVLAAIASGEVRKCVYGPYKGDGIPPECTLTILDEKEKAQQSKVAKAYFEAQRKTLTENAKLFHGLLINLIDFESCW